MKISTWFLLCLLILFIINFYNTYIIAKHQFIETTCVTGKIKNMGNKQIVQCIGCHNFRTPINSKSYGILRINNEVNKKQNNVEKKSNLLIGIWLQKSCNDYQCPSLLEKTESFNLPTQKMKEASFALFSKYQTNANSQNWSVNNIQYDNILLNQYDQEPESFSIKLWLRKLILSIMGSFPNVSSTLYSSSMAVRFRYQLSQSATQFYKPIVFIQQKEETIFSYIILSLLVGYTLYSKTFFEQVSSSTYDNQRPPFIEIFLCLGFIFPHLVSLISIIVLAITTNNSSRSYKIWYILAILLYLGYLVSGYFLLALISAKICLVTQFKLQDQENKISNISGIEVLLFIILLICNHYFIGLLSLIDLSPNLVYALVYEPPKQTKVYTSVPRLKQMIELQEIQEM